MVISVCHLTDQVEITGGGHTPILSVARGPAPPPSAGPRTPNTNSIPSLASDSYTSVPLGGYDDPFQCHQSPKIDEARSPDYYAACHAGSIVPPFCPSRVAALLLFIRYCRINLSSSVEQSAGTDFWAYGLCSGHRTRCVYGRTCCRKRVAWRVGRTQRPARCAVWLDRTRRGGQRRGFAGWTDGCARSVCCCVPSRRRAWRNSFGAAICGRGRRSFSPNISDGRDAARARAWPCEVFS